MLTSNEHRLELVQHFADRSSPFRNELTAIQVKERDRHLAAIIKWLAPAITEEIEMAVDLIPVWINQQRLLEPSYFRKAGEEGGSLSSHGEVRAPGVGAFKADEDQVVELVGEPGVEVSVDLIAEAAGVAHGTEMIDDHLFGGTLAEDALAEAAPTDRVKDAVIHENRLVDVCPALGSLLRRPPEIVEEPPSGFADMRIIREIQGGRAANPDHRSVPAKDRP
jgi:hypothetical protein